VCSKDVHVGWKGGAQPCCRGLERFCPRERRAGSRREHDSEQRSKEQVGGHLATGCSGCCKRVDREAMHGTNDEPIAGSIARDTSFVQGFADATIIVLLQSPMHLCQGFKLCASVSLAVKQRKSLRRCSKITQTLRHKSKEEKHRNTVAQTHTMNSSSPS
jgi:hypothetical protein